MNYYEIVEQFKTAMITHGIRPPPNIYPDGKLHRFYVEGHKKGTLNAAYLLHVDGIRPAGYFEDFKQGYKINWKYDGDVKPLSNEEKAKYAEQQRLKAEQRQKEQEERFQKAAIRARKLWEQGRKITSKCDHPYLQQKNVEPYNLRMGNWSVNINPNGEQPQYVTLKDTLLIPKFDENRTLWSLQGIFANEVPELGRNKDNLPGGKKTGLFYWVGEKSSPVCLGEGYSTCWSIHKATGLRCYIAFDANNLIHVGKLIRAKLPDEKIIFCSDNDSHQTGQNKAVEAALAVDGFVCMPPQPDTDYNDWLNTLETHGGEHG